MHCLTVEMISINNMSLYFNYEMSVASQKRASEGLVELSLEGRLALLVVVDADQAVLLPGAW